MDKWDSDWEKCVQYAEAEFSSVQKSRRQRGQRNVNRIKHQATVGKFGEILVCDFLRFYGHRCTSPDFKIYSNKDKSWDSDLFVGKHRTSFYL